MKKKIAILGATSHIAKGIIENILNDTIDEYDLVLFEQSVDTIDSFIQENHLKNISEKRCLDDFTRGSYDVIINCIGIGSPLKLKSSGSIIFELTEKFDNIIIDYLKRNNEVLYVNFSSGAVYGNNFRNPVDANSKSFVNINDIQQADFYQIAKLNSEIKHRSLAEFNIVDLRVFGYFSKYINLDAGFLMSEVIHSLIKNQIFKTSPENIIRDFISPKDLYNLIKKCIRKHNLNIAFDVYSKAPVEKFEILDSLSQKYDFKYEVFNKGVDVSATGFKENYYSVNTCAEILNFKPIYNSLETILLETDQLLKRI